MHSSYYSVLTSLIQEIFNALPNASSEEFCRSLVTKNNDQNFVLYISSIVRAIISLHNLINNKLQNKEAERLNQEKAENKDEKAIAGGAAADKTDKTEKTDKTDKTDKNEKPKEEKK